jgi:hypothetical protein
MNVQVALKARTLGIVPQNGAINAELRTKRITTVRIISHVNPKRGIGVFARV